MSGFPPRTPQQWETWWEEFKKRNGLTPEKLAELAAGPKPLADAPPPPRHHSDAEPDEEGTT
jgi:hypothetical protein